MPIIPPNAPNAVQVDEIRIYVFKHPDGKIDIRFNKTEEFDHVHPRVIPIILTSALSLAIKVLHAQGIEKDYVLMEQAMKQLNEEFIDSKNAHIEVPRNG